MSTYLESELAMAKNEIRELSLSIGSLSKVLSVFSFYGINLTKIQSLPIIGREWEYQFYVDLTFSDLTRYKQSLQAIRPLTSELKLLGKYPKKKQSEL